MEEKSITEKEKTGTQEHLSETLKDYFEILLEWSKDKNFKRERIS